VKKNDCEKLAKALDGIMKSCTRLQEMDREIGKAAEERAKAAMVVGG